jgi:arginyl-tRNA synthetase
LGALNFDEGCTVDIKESLEGLIDEAISAALNDGSITLKAGAARPEPALERPRDEANGDWASTVAMRAAKAAGKAPREIAQVIVDHIPANDIIKQLEIAGPGFINIRLTESVLQGVVARVRLERGNFGKSEPTEATKNVNLEYVSANPTGPLHVGHGRWACLGDSIARVMRHAGYTVHEEFYINDHGTQMDVFGNSISVRYMQALGHDIKMPEACYGGAYVCDIAQQIIAEAGNKYEAMTADVRAREFREIGYKLMLADQQAILARMGTTFDRWFSERDLYVADEAGQTAVDRALAAMREKGYVEERDGAVWFKSSELGDEKDRVLIKANGEMTYFMSDCAYHYNKMMRGFDRLIDVWGADHHGYIKRCECMLEAWGYPGVLEVVLGQLVNLFRDGVAVRMSKRTGEMVTLEELVDEVGVDATRYLMLSRSSDQPIDFDIEVAKKKDASNPVYYVQYAHARICSILRKAATEAQLAAYEAGQIDMDELAAQVVGEGVTCEALTHEAELALMRKMADFGGLVALAARDREPFKLTHYAQELAGLFHGFYTNCKVLGVGEDLTRARLALCDSARIVLALTLGLLGVSAPEQM